MRIDANSMSSTVRSDRSHVSASEITSRFTAINPTRFLSWVSTPRRSSNSQIRIRPAPEAKGWHCTPALVRPVAPQERERCLDESRRVAREYRTMSGVWNDPEVRTGNRRSELERQRDRIERVPIAKHDQRLRCDRAKRWRREAHVVVAIGERSALPEQFLELCMAVTVPFAHQAKLGLGKHGFGRLPLERARLRREVPVVRSRRPWT